VKWSDRRVVGTSLVIVVGCAIAGLMVDWKAFLVNVLAGLICLGIGFVVAIFIVDRFARRLRERQWARTQQSTLQAIASHLCEIAGGTFQHYSVPYDIVAPLFAAYSSPVDTSLIDCFKKLEVHLASLPAAVTNFRSTSDVAVEYYKALRWDLDQIQTVLTPRVMESPAHQTLIDRLADFDQRRRELHHSIRAHKQAVTHSVHPCLVSLIGAAEALYSEVCRYYVPNLTLNRPVSPQRGRPDAERQRESAEYSGRWRFNMQPIGFTTDKVSWTLLLSGFRRMQSPEARDATVNLNSEAGTCVVLSCTAAESFVNEVSSLTHSFIFDRRDDTRGQSSRGVTDEVLAKVASIRLDKRGSFYVRYRCLLRALGIGKPRFLSDLSALGKLRNSLVHFRDCDVPIIDDRGVIKHGQELPPAAAAMRSKKHDGVGVLASDAGTAWTLRLATDAMAAWSLSLAFDAAMHVLDNLPPGEYRAFLWRAYAHRNTTLPLVFLHGKRDLATWWQANGVRS